MIDGDVAAAAGHHTPLTVADHAVYAGNHIPPSSPTATRAAGNHTSRGRGGQTAAALRPRRDMAARDPAAIPHIPIGQYYPKP